MDLTPNAKKVAAIESGEAPVTEPELPEYIERNKRDSLQPLTWKQQYLQPT